MDYLSRREHSRYELTQKLARKGFSINEIEPALDRLVGQNLQSDQRFTDNYIASRQRAGFGPRAIQRDLQQKRVDAELVAQSLTQAPQIWSETLQQAWLKKFSGNLPNGDQKELARQTRFLVGRGFALDQVMDLLNNHVSSD